jgi:hypothetical protein
MSDIRIIHPDDDGGIVVIIPTDEALEEHTAEEIAQKDVPEGKPYKIVTVNDLPADRDFRNAWEVDVALLTDGVGSESNDWAE